MKKIYFPLIIFVLILSCSSNIEKIQEIIEEKPTTLLEIKISDDYFEDYESGYVFLTNDLGEIISEIALNNNLNTKLSKTYDINANNYHLTFVKKSVVNNETFLSLTTCNEIKPFLMDLDKNTFFSTEDYGKAKVTVINTHENLDFFLGTNSGSAVISNNKAEFELSLNAYKQIYITLKSSSENPSKYIWMDNVVKDSETVFEYNDLPFFNKELKIKTPQNTPIGYSVFANKGDVPENAFWLKFMPSQNITSDITIGFPDEFFTVFRSSLSFKINNKSCTFLDYNNKINQFYEVPNMNFEVLNNSIEDFRASANGTYKYYGIHFSKTNMLNQSVLSWTFIGKNSNSIKLILPKLLPFITDSIGNFSFSDLSLKSMSITEDNRTNPYQSYLLKRFSKYRAFNYADEYYRTINLNNSF